MFDILKSLSLKDAQRVLLQNKDYSQEEVNCLRKISTQVHKNEHSYLKNNSQHYLNVGLSALNCIRNAIITADNSPPKSILDFPSGYGRVLRFLTAAYPDASIACMDIDPIAVKFCEKHFGVKSSLSDVDFSMLEMEFSFDLIWCGSLVTHITESQTRSLLQFFYQHLNSNGLCVFTTHGKQVEQLLQTRHLTYSLQSQQIDLLIETCKQTGYAFTEYEPSRGGYGFSLSSDEKIRSIALESGNWECTCYEPHGWDNHQDVYTYQKTQ